MGATDVIVIGAGHNGLVAAAYLAKAGRSVLVLEQRDSVGGAAVTEEVFPGFKVSTVADGGGYLSQSVRDDLKLDSRVEIVHSDAVAFCPQPDGSQLTIWRDTARTVEEIARFSQADAAAYPGYIELMSRIAAVIRGMMDMTPPNLPNLGAADLRGALGLLGPMWQLGRKNVKELLRHIPMSTNDMLNEHFDSTAVKAAIGASSIQHVSLGPRETGTTLAMLQSWALSGTGLFRSASVVKGGMGALTGAIADAARSFGAEIRTGATVEKAIIEDGRVTGVRLEGGETISANIVVSNADPRTTFTKLLDPRELGASFMHDVRNIKYRGSSARIHLALSDLPTFTAADGDPAKARTQLSAPIQLAPSLDDVERAFDCSKYGTYSERPVLDVLIPSLSDPELVPSGQHVMSITARFAPYSLRGDSWDDHREAFGDRAIATLAEYAPGIRDLILHRRVLTPIDLERDFALPEGNPNHGEMLLDQFFHMRPVGAAANYRTPIKGAYICGAGCHPGAGVSGIPGSNAAREILKDTQWRKRTLVQDFAYSMGDLHECDA